MFYTCQKHEKITSVKCAISKKNVFHPILMKFGEVVVPIVYYNYTKFHQCQMKNKKVLLIAHLTDDSSTKVPLKSC